MNKAKSSTANLPSKCRSSNILESKVSKLTKPLHVSVIPHDEYTHLSTSIPKKPRRSKSNRAMIKARTDLCIGLRR